MFKIFNKNKNNDKRKKISNARMSDDAFFKAVEPAISAVWVDKQFLLQTGINSIRDENLSVKNDISYDDAVHCYKAGLKMYVAMSNAMQVMDKKGDAVEKELIAAGANMGNKKEHPFYTLDSMIDIIKDCMINPNIEGQGKPIPDNKDELIANINELLPIIKGIEEAFVTLCCISAHLDGAYMVAYI